MHPWKTRGLSLLAALAVVGLLWIAPAHAVTVTLSSDSSDSDYEAASLAATLEFELSDPSTLEITLLNQSDFNIEAIYFNALPSVTGLSLASGPNDWKLETPEKKGDPTDTGVFGVFDYVVWVKGKKADNGSVEPGMSAVFEINILGAGPFSALDFTSDASLAEGDELAARLAALFADGKHEVIGAAHAPEPSSLLLTALGITGLAVALRRRRGFDETQSLDA